MAKFSANLGFLWSDLSLPESIRVAAESGFAGIECHWPYETPASEIKAVLDEVGLPMISINTVPGDTKAGEFGLTSIPEKASQAKAAISQALEYADAIGAAHVHVLAGLNAGSSEGHEAYVTNLKEAAASAESIGIGILIEPLNNRDVPSYFLNGLDQALDIVREINAPNLRIMFDCYHQQIIAGDLMNRLQEVLAYVGHIQVASVPDRHEPDEGEISYERLIPYLDRLGYEGFIGAEYRPRRGTEEGLGWLRWFSG